MASEIDGKRHKVDTGHGMGTGLEEDRLSSLPDDIIQHILSFIDTKFAVQTCVLSSRWKLVWTSIPHLNLSSGRFRILPKFSKFVNRVLCHRNKCVDVLTLDLTFRGRLGQKFVEKIASYVMSHNVQQIKITFDTPEGTDQFPHCVFGSESLKHLSLCTGHSVYTTVPCAQSPWNFPALTTLDLKNIRLCPDNTDNLDLFSKCVNLKNLTLDDCRARSLGVMHICCPQLVNLTINSGWITKFALMTPKLSSFYYYGSSWLSLSSKGLRCLDTVDLEMPSMSNTESEEHRQRDAYRLLSTLQELSNAKHLVLHVKIIEFLATVPDILEKQPSQFSNLKFLKIKYDQTRSTTDSNLIDHVIKYLVNGSSGANAILELPQKCNLSPYLWHSTRRDLQWLKSQKRNWLELCKLTDILSSQNITDPPIRQALEDLKVKLAVQCEELGLRLPRWSN